jgi:hypothetical protein
MAAKLIICVHNTIQKDVMQFYFSKLTVATDKPIRYSRVLSEELIFTQLVKKFPHFYGIKGALQ